MIFRITREINIDIEQLIRDEKLLYTSTGEQIEQGVRDYVSSLDDEDYYLIGNEEIISICKEVRKVLDLYPIDNSNPKWLGVHRYNTIDTMPLDITHAVCQLCGSTLEIVSRKLPYYCPYCGDKLNVDIY